MSTPSSRHDKQCFSKIRYSNQMQASAAAGRLEVFLKNQNNQEVHARTYSCKICQGWHITKIQRDNNTSFHGRNAELNKELLNIFTQKL